MPLLPLRLRRPSAPMLVALLALFVALGGPAHAAKLLDGKQIKRGSIGSKQIKDRSLMARDLSPGAVGSLTATPDGAITAAKLGENSVTTRAIAPGSVLTGNVADNTLTAADLAANAVATEEIADNAVGQTEIRNNGVAASEIADNSIDGGEIIDGGLSIGDVARRTGTLAWQVPALTPASCDVEVVEVRGIRAGDLVVLSPTSAWPQHVVYSVVGTGADAFTVQACALKALSPGGTYTFSFAVLGL